MYRLICPTGSSVHNMKLLFNWSQAWLLEPYSAAKILNLLHTAIQAPSGVVVGQLNETWAVNYTVDRSYPSWAKLAKKPSASFQSKIDESFRPSLKAPCTTIILVGMLKIYLCPIHITQVLRLPATVSPFVLPDASL